MAEQYPLSNDGPAYPLPPDYPSPPEYPSAPYPPPPGYAYPYPYGAPYGAPMPARGTNGFAIASLVCGILFLCAGIFGSILAVVFGHIALVQIKRSGDMESGRGLAIAGLVIGYIGLGLSLLYILFLIGLTVIPLYQSSYP